MNLPPYGDEFRRNNNHLSSLYVTPSPIPDMFLDISPGGFWLLNKTWVEFVGGRSPGFTAPTHDAKWDLLCIHYNGSAMIIEGTPSTNPVLPSLERKAFPLVAIYLEQGDNKITSEKIFDIRGLFGTTSYYHRDLEDRDFEYSHPIEAITGLREELDNIIGGNYVSNLLDAKADVNGTTENIFTLNKDFTGTPASHCGITVERGIESNAIFRFNEDLNQWEYTNNSIDWVQLTDQGPSVSLPIASDTLLGGIKVGARLTINSTTGIIDADLQSANDFTNTYKAKLESVEHGATEDMTPNEIKVSYESNIDTNVFTDADRAKLDGIENGATAGVMSAGDIKIAYESNSNTNAYTDTEKNKLATIEIGATDDMTSSEIKASYESNSNTNAFTDTEKVKLTGIEDSANNYIHPVTHLPSIIVQDPNNRFVTDSEKTVWGSKADPTNYWSKTELSSTGGSRDRMDWSPVQNAPVFGSESWLYPVADIAARDAIATPSSGNCVLVQDDGDGKAAQYIYNGTIWVKLGDVDWSPMTDTQIKTAYENNADTNAYTDSEKTKLTSIEDSANNFTLDPATDSVLGGIMVGSGLSVDVNGLLALDYTFDDAAHGARSGGNLHQVANITTAGFMSSADKTKLDGIATNANLYVLPVSSDTILGGVKIDPTGGINIDGPSSQISVQTGDVGTLGRLGVDGSGHINISSGMLSVSEADGSTFGVVQIGSNINVSGGVISIAHAQGSNLGLVSVGNNIELDDVTGEISVDWASLPFDDSMHGTRIGGNLHALVTDSNNGFMSSSDKTKLDTMESGATADMTNSEIKSAYESNSDTNVFTDSEKTKLSGLEDNATADMTALEIKTAYESNSDTNSFTDALQTKLNGIEASANNYVHPLTHDSTDIIHPITTIVRVDVNRVDSYTADGSFTKPFKTLTDAIANAPSGDVVFRVSPGTYTENIVVEAGMHFFCDSMEKNYVAKINGTVLYNTTNTSGGADGNIASFCGIDLSSDGVNSSLQFYGSNPQRLNLFNCEIISSGLQPALFMNNTGLNSLVVAKGTNFKNTSSGRSFVVDHGKLSLWKTQSIVTESNNACDFSNAAQIDSTMSFFGGIVSFSDTSGGNIFSPIFQTVNSPIFNRGGTLNVSNPVNLGAGALIELGSTGQTIFKNESDTIAYTPTQSSDWSSTPDEVKAALDELASRVKAIEDSAV